MQVLCLRVICAFGNLPQKAVPSQPFRGEFCLGGSVDVCPEPDKPLYDYMLTSDMKMDSKKYTKCGTLLCL